MQIWGWVWLVVVVMGVVACQPSDTESEPIPTRFDPPTAIPSDTPGASSPTVTATASRPAVTSPAPPSETPTEAITEAAIVPTASNTSKPTRTTTPAPTLIRGAVQSEVGAYVRRGPGTEYEIAGELLPGTAFTVLAYSENARGEIWFLVYLESGQQAWIADSVVGLIDTSITDIALAIAAPASMTPTLPPSETPSPTASPLPQGTTAIVTGNLGVNLRDGASYGYDVIRTLERDAPLVIIGRNASSTWYQVTTFDQGDSGWVNANFVDALINLESVAITWTGPGDITGVECGINIHPKNGEGWQSSFTNDLARTEWVRFPFTSSPRHFASLEQAFAFFDPVIDTYNDLGVKVLLVLTHETYGELAGWEWNNMDSAAWRSFTDQYTATLTRIVSHYGNQVAAYEIWNEGDAEPNNPAAVTISPEDYAGMLGAAARVVRTYAPQSQVILGGLLDASGTYLRRVEAASGGSLPVAAIAIHPYGRGAPNDETVFSNFGALTDVIDAYQRVAPNIPLWLTEVGAIGDNSPGRWAEAATYMRNLFGYVKAAHYDSVDVIIWYAWSDAMHPEVKTNGLVTANQQPKDPLYNTFFGLCG